MPPGKGPADLIVVGGGVVGLSVAMLAVRQGLSVQVIEGEFQGAASPVAAGLLAPSLGRSPPEAADAFRLANSGYARFLDMIREASGQSELVAGQGILEIALDPSVVRTLNEANDPAAVMRSSARVAQEAPDLAAVSGAVLHPNDGWIEPRSLLNGLVASLPDGTITKDRVSTVEAGRDLRVTLSSGQVRVSGHLVVAAGCWSPLIKGIPGRLPIFPARGEVLVMETTHALPYAIACDEGYLVPRPGNIVVGSTYELVGFEANPTPNGRADLEKFAATVIPGAFARASRVTAWAGLRPMTPDKLPIVDIDPDEPRIVYACGHGKNGLLLAGLTAQLTLSLLSGNRLDAHSPFRLDRFASR